MLELEDFDDESLPKESLRQSRKLPDGSIEFDIISPEDEIQDAEVIEEVDFYENLAAKMDQKDLDFLATELLEEVSTDISSRSDWDSKITLGYKYLGYQVEELKKNDFFEACAAFDSSMSTTLINIYATARAELLPAEGPCRVKINGSPTVQEEEKGERVKYFMNYYLTDYDRSYYPDFERLLLYVCFFGSAFKKIWQDPILNEPRSRFIAPQNFIINSDSVDVLSSSRMTEVMSLSKKEVMLLEQSGEYLPDGEDANYDDEDQDNDSQIEATIKRIEGVDPDGGDDGKKEDKTNIKLYEMHVERNISVIKSDTLFPEQAKIPRPYTITICPSTRKIKSIKRNWEEKKPNFKRKECYGYYYYLPGFGIYGLGICQLLGSNAIAQTNILRQSIDANYFANFPAYLKTKSLTSEDNNVGLMPGEGREIDTLGAPISDCIMKLPYEGPSEVGIALREQLKQETMAHGGAPQTQIADIGPTAPVGTTMALLEVAGRMQSTILRSLRCSLDYELQLLFKLFAEFLPDEPYPFSVPGKEYAIMRQDFSDNIKITPVSDPNVITSMHRLIRNESILKIAQMYPQLHNTREVLYRMYSSMNVEDIDKILPPLPSPVPLDPISENMNIVIGMPIIADMSQDHQAHKLIHTNATSDPMLQGFFQNNPAAYATLILHNQQHEAFEALQQLEQQKQQEEEQRIQEMQMQGMMDPMGGMSQMMQPQMGQQQMEGWMSPDNAKPEEKIRQIQIIPEVQNLVAQKNAQCLSEQMERMNAQQKEMNDKQIDPQQVVLADIDQRREAAQLKNDEENQRIELDKYKLDLSHEEFKIKYEIESYKAKLKNESEMAKIQAQREIAEEKNDVDLIIEEHKGSQKGVQNERMQQG